MEKSRWTSSADIVQTSSTISADGAGNITATASTIRQFDSSFITSGTGTIDLDANDDISIASLTTAGEVQIDTLTGAIIDSGDSHTDITAATAELLAATGIGDAGDPNGELDTAADPTAGSLTIAAETEAGDINVTNDGRSDRRNG